MAAKPRLKIGVVSRFIFECYVVKYPIAADGRASILVAMQRSLSPRIAFFESEIHVASFVGYHRAHDIRFG